MKIWTSRKFPEFHLTRVVVHNRYWWLVELALGRCLCSSIFGDRGRYRLSFFATIGSKILAYISISENTNFVLSKRFHFVLEFWIFLAPLKKCIINDRKLIAPLGFEILDHRFQNSGSSLSKFWILYFCFLCQHADAPHPEGGLDPAALEPVAPGLVFFVQVITTRVKWNSGNFLDHKMGRVIVDSAVLLI